MRVKDVDTRSAERHNGWMRTAAVLFLVTSTFVTGTVLCVDGGLPHASL